MTGVNGLSSPDIYHVSAVGGWRTRATRLLSISAQVPQGIDRCYFLILTKAGYRPRVNDPAQFSFSHETARIHFRHLPEVSQGFSSFSGLRPVGRPGTNVPATIACANLRS